MTCQCNFHCRHRVIVAELEKLSAESREFFENIVEDLYNVEADNDYYEAVLAGAWPSGKEVLEFALEKYDNE